MRKIIILTFLSLDGVMQAPGGPEEDTSGGFAYGGWTVPFSNEDTGKAMVEQIKPPFELLLGRKTYDIFAAYWPYQSNEGAIAGPFNAARKYVASHHNFEPTWENTTVLTGDVVEQIRQLKSEDGPDLQVHGSGNFIQTLLENDLVDEMWLKFYPVTLGKGKRLFAEGAMPAAFKLTGTKIFDTGVIFANYARDGEVKTGEF